ncbi:aspartate 1-decarboxylase [Bacillus aquiflavi]|uniref:Aspartate 1-decarboxylase n=1 Tax=Bacillus aquiflavi TaxID=2672567 RepID=A0A6B3W010_9BACI|nr:aspartate 1-decarboxylase [Bacillus aquiflavi]MBA4536819.1 aspartate 1-decarboxylase [Bacillus aquiflavi]NEY81186.1 aspartate 1-decarboxylase [Bacillus aquiflavi]UAC49747.1 aspartate 1-decarboxylase [Bacillus aquiflavi]
MYRTLMKSKIHGARVTESNLNYVGSITIDREIIDSLGIMPNEKVQIVNNNNGARFETYVIPGNPGEKEICLNGAAARLVQKGDVVIIISYALVHEDELEDFRCNIAIMDENNNIKKIIHQEIANSVV